MRTWLREHWFDALWVLAFGLLGSLWCVSAARQIGPTFDEPFYLFLFVLIHGNILIVPLFIPVWWLLLPPFTVWARRRFSRT